MDMLLFRLAERMGLDPLVADKTGGYHFLIDGYSLYLERLGTQIVVRSLLDWQIDTGAPADLDLVQRALGMVARWGRQFPQALVMNPQGGLVLEARLELEGLGNDEVERVLAAQVGILESLESIKLLKGPGSQWRPSIWRP